MRLVVCRRGGRHKGKTSRSFHPDWLLPGYAGRGLPRRDVTRRGQPSRDATAGALLAATKHDPRRLDRLNKSNRDKPKLNQLNRPVRINP